MRSVRWTLPPLLCSFATACPPYPIDPDGDGYVEDDCKTHYAAIHPEAVDPYGDGIDQDCDGWDGTHSDFDVDGDGQRSSAYDGRDCDDDEPTIYAGAEEICGDGFVNDCDRSAVSASLDCRMEGDLMEEGRYTVVVGHAAGAWAGYRVADAGDVDGDGKSDVLVSAPTGNSAPRQPGAIYLITDPSPGTIDMAESDETVLLGSLDGDLAGCGISAAGDLNGDHYGDIAVGSAWAIESPSENEGILQILYGPLSTTGVAAPGLLADEADVTISGAGGFGVYISLIGDADGDGDGDLSVGAYRAYEGRGAIYVVTGQDIDTAADDPSQADADSLTMEMVGVSGSETGRSTCGGDMDGDGLSEVVTGAWREAGTAEGVSYLGSVSGMTVSPGSWSVSSADFYLHAENAGDNLGWAVACGDVTGDGLTDVMAGAMGYAGGGDRPGVVYVLPASVAGRGALSNVREASVAVLTGSTDGGSFGSAISASGDMDGDGLADLLVGSFGFTSAADPPEVPGRIYLFYASGGLEGHITAGSASAVITGQSNLDLSGAAVSEGGDFNGDGWPDMLVGAPWDSQKVIHNVGGAFEPLVEPKAGRAYILYGGGY